MPRISKVAHVVLGVRDPKKSAKFYAEALGMQEVNCIEEGGHSQAFLSFGERDHDIALVRVPEGEPVGSFGRSHTALEIEGGEKQLREFYQRLKDYGAEVENTVNHVITKSIYFLDPDGNRLEIFTQTLEPGEAKQYLRDAQGFDELVKPLDLGGHEPPPHVGATPRSD